jgi:hypothetical protein
VAAGKPMPEAGGDADYESPERLVAHVQGSARSYLLWIFEVLGPADRGARADPRSGRSSFRGWTNSWRRRWPAGNATSRASRTTSWVRLQHKSRWGDPYMVDQMLEHAIVHPDAASHPARADPRELADFSGLDSARPDS